MKFGNEDDIVIVGVAGQQLVVEFCCFCILHWGCFFRFGPADGRCIASKPARVPTWLLRQCQVEWHHASSKKWLMGGITTFLGKVFRFRFGTCRGAPGSTRCLWQMQSQRMPQHGSRRFTIHWRPTIQKCTLFWSNHLDPGCLIAMLDHHTGTAQHGFLLVPTFPRSFGAWTS